MHEEIQIFNFPQDLSIEVFYKQPKFSMSQTDLILTPPSFPLFAWKFAPPPVFFISGDDGKLMYPDVQIRNLGDITDPTFFFTPHIHLVTKSYWLVVPLEFVSSSPLVQALKSKSDSGKILKWPPSLPYLNSSQYKRYDIQSPLSLLSPPHIRTVSERPQVFACVVKNE